MEQIFKSVFEEIDWLGPIDSYSVKFIRSYLIACDQAQKLDVYCWLCASYNLQKNGIRYGRFKKASCSFHCLDCNSDMSYPIGEKQYNKLNFWRPRKKAKNKYKPRRQ